MPTPPPAPSRIWKRHLLAVAVLAALAASPQQARAADYTRPPGTVTVYRQPVVPPDDSATASPHHETETADDDTSRAVKTAAIGTVVTIVIAAGICLATSGAVCMFPLGF